MLARRHRGTRGFASAFLRGGGSEPQMSVKWGATGLRDPLQKEADLAVLSPPPRIMNAHMDAFMISKLQEARDRGPEQFQALLNAKAAHTYDDVLQAEANVQNEKFAQVNPYGHFQTCHVTRLLTITPEGLFLLSSREGPGQPS